MSSPEKNRKISFSIVIPAYNEAGSIERTVDAIVHEFSKAGVDEYEILVVNDNSSDDTESILSRLQQTYDALWYVNNEPPNGFGFAVRRGLLDFRGDAVCVVMADLSDSPKDILTYYREMQRGAECVFGSRFMKGSEVIDYPKFKLFINRLANFFIKTVFRLKHNDITNAFKAYRREAIEGVQPILSHHFNLTVELPLKAITRGFSYTTVPISWTNRIDGESKLKLKEMGSRYLFIVLYVLIEKWLTKGDYDRGPNRQA